MQRCNNDNECSPSQCCVEEHRFWIASKREVAKPHPFYAVEDSIPGNTPDMKFSICTLQEEIFYWNSNIAISLMANSANLNSAYYCILRNLSMTGYVI